MASLLWKRQGFGDNSNDDGDDGGLDYYDYGNWWWTPTGIAVRYAIIAVLFGLILLYFIGGYMHARRRMRKNLPPLQYHRWMVRNSRQPLYHGQPYYQPQQQSFGMNQYPQHGYQNSQGGYAPPPPAYGHYEAPPPVYQPPAGGSKVAADQNYGGEHGEGSNGAPEVHVRES